MHLYIISSCFLLITLRFISMQPDVLPKKLSKILENGFTCSEMESMIPRPDLNVPRQTKDAYRITVRIEGPRTCHLPRDKFIRVEVEPKTHANNIFGYTLQARRGPKFNIRVGRFNKAMINARVHCDEIAAVTHKSYSKMRFVQMQWVKNPGWDWPIRNDSLLFKATILDESGWFSINHTVLSCATVDECISNPCNNGTCLDGLAGYSCHCNNGFAGVHCDSDFLECQSNPCVNGVCRERFLGYICSCNDGFTGTFCEINIDECKSNPCIRGNCTDLVNRYQCVCPKGWRNDTNCDEDVLDCTPNICQNNGSCSEEPGAGFHNCSCHGGWTGVNCTEDIVDCLPNLCLNDGTCTEEPGSGNYTCLCTKNWTGFNCTEDVVDCLPGVCHNDGHCTEEPGEGTYLCKNCSEGWTGQNCSETITPCTLFPCRNNATCKPDKNNTEFWCDCTDGFKGRLCERYAIDKCKSAPCQNGGTCTQRAPASYACTCTHGITGNNCEKVDCLFTENEIYKMSPGKCSCIRLVFKYSTWVEANKVCNLIDNDKPGFSGNLVMIPNQGTADLLIRRDREYLKRFGNIAHGWWIRYVWIGLKSNVATHSVTNRRILHSGDPKLKMDEWEWVRGPDGTRRVPLTFIPASGILLNNGSDRCMSLASHHNYSYDDLSCGLKKYFFCELVLDNCTARPIDQTSTKQNIINK